MFAANSKVRRQIVLNAKEKKGFSFDGENKAKPNPTWAKMLAKVFGIDVLKCVCGGDLKPIAALRDPRSVKRYLDHVGLDSSTPVRGPPPLCTPEIVYHFD